MECDSTLEFHSFPNPECACHQRYEMFNFSQRKNSFASFSTKDIMETHKSLQICLISQKNSMNDNFFASGGAVLPYRLYLYHYVAHLRRLQNVINRDH